MGELTSAEGSLEVAAVALLLVLGFRLVRPSGGGSWVAFAAYAAGLVAQVLGAAGLLPGTVYTAGPALRIAGAVALVAGLVLAGAPARGRRRAARPSARGEPVPARGEPVEPRATTRSAPGPSAMGHAGLALVAAGQLLRGPSQAALLPVGLAVLMNAGVALLARGRGPGVTSAAAASRGPR